MNQLVTWNKFYQINLSSTAVHEFGHRLMIARTSVTMNSDDDGRLKVVMVINFKWCQTWTKWTTTPASWNVRTNPPESMCIHIATLHHKVLRWDKFVTASLATNESSKTSKASRARSREHLRRREPGFEHGTSRRFIHFSKQKSNCFITFVAVGTIAECLLMFIHEALPLVMAEEFLAGIVGLRLAPVSDVARSAPSLPRRHRRLIRFRDQRLHQSFPKTYPHLLLDKNVAKSDKLARL